ncbi:type I secretion system permease/ATPase [Ramlibacter sp.]|uniref:type I secretion system permease/ATPase n=1 Tax=Ramlibacter sp. TaxID=1917967 RepID=UPI002D590F99|nr:type I secretion system permease/ATPase [Ramlibacter sp.]HYD75385.1 type I secretion system permease/ATPase [Ramlibacter sp.]
MKLAGARLWSGLLAWNRPDWLAVTGFAAVINLLMLVPTLYMLQIYDRVLISGSQWTLLAVSLITVFLLGVMAAADWFRSRLLIRIGLSLDARLAPAVFQSAYRQRLQGRPAGITQSLGDLTQVRQYLTGPGFLALLDVPWVPVYVGVLFLLHPVLGMAALVFGALQLAATWLSHRGSQQRVEQAQQASQRADGAAAHFLRAGEVIRAMGMGARMRRLWQERHGQAMRVEGEVEARQARWTGWSKWLRYTQQAASLGVGAWLVIRGELTVGAMIAGNVLTTRALAPLDAWAQTWGLALGAGKAFERLKALLATSTHEHAPALAQGASPSVAGEVIRLKQVGVSFDGRPAPALQHIDLALHKGELVLLQGASGSGKTTLARTVLGIVAPTEGRVLWQLGERPASEAIGYLPQSVDLFAGTVAENIARFAEPDSRKVIEAARLAGLHETIQRMPMGYDTPVGAGGHFLSGGQRQRIALARAVYGLPELIVLDEPNAQLDSSGEVALLQALVQLKRRGCAVLVISHRPGVLQVADTVVTLARGRIASQARPARAAALPEPVAA